LILLSILFAACGSSSTQQSQQKGLVSLNILATPGGNFTAANFNPFIDTNIARSGTRGMIYEPLIFQNRLTGEVTGTLASSYQIASDASSITFTLRQGIKWSDGQPFTSDDVLFTLDLLKKFPGLDLQGIWTTIIKDVAAPDANTIKVTFKSPNSVATWFFNQTFIVPKHLWSSIADPTRFTNDNPVGTGPFKLSKFQPEVYSLVKNPLYWQADKVKVDELRYKAANDNTSAQVMISSGQIDWAGIGWDPKYDIQFTKKDPEHYHHWFPPTNTVMLYMNLTKAPYNDLNVRKAISLAINRDQIHAAAALYATPAHPSALLPTTKDYISTEYQSLQFKPDIAQANQLLQQAGFTKGSDGIYAKNGKKISFQMIVPNGWNDWVASLKVISENLKQIGIDAQVSALATDALWKQNLNAGNFDVAIGGTTAGPTPYFFLKDLLLSTNSWAKGKNAIGTNWEHWQDPTTDAFLTQYLGTTDPAQQKQAIQGLEKVMVEQIPAIPLDYNVGWFEYTTTKVTGWPDDHNAYDYGSPFNYPDNEYIILHLTPTK
jgi:peptide/nickel transport system substrate-binding protein